MFDSTRPSLSLFICLALAASASACQSTRGADGEPSSTKQPDLERNSNEAPQSQPAQSGEDSSGQPLAEPPPEGLKQATFAGGCFWCMEGPFESISGVKDAFSGYTGGSEQRPVYEQVSRGRTGHTEAVRVFYDPDEVTYEVLLEAFWRSMDPTDLGGQFADRGSQYRPAIFVHDEAQRQAAEASKKALSESGRFTDPIVVPIERAGDFWVAEGYHQDYYKTNPAHYKRYRKGSGREAFLQRIWGEEH